MIDRLYYATGYDDTKVIQITNCFQKNFAISQNVKSKIGVK